MGRVGVYLLGAALLWLGATASAQAAEAFTIERYDTVIRVREDSSIAVQEWIEVDFGGNERHGIFRTLPTKAQMSTGANRSIRVRDVAVHDGYGAAIPVELSRGWGEFNVKIGDSDRTVTGRQTYELTYVVDGALNFFDDHAELYWNATGTGWDTSIRLPTASVILPRSAESLTAQAFQGVAGGSEVANASAKGEAFGFSATRSLEPGEGFTVIAGWPLGVVAPPSAWTRAWWFVADNGILALPLFVIAWLVWYIRRYGKDPFGRGTIAPEFAPPKRLSLLEQAALRDEQLQARDLAALIVSWAVGGYLVIEEPKKGKLTLVRKQALFGQSAAEHKFFDAIFAKGRDGRVTPKELAGTLESSASALCDAVFTGLVEKGYFTANPQIVRGWWIGGGVLLMLPGLFLGAIFGLPWLIAFVVSGLLMIGASWLMPKRTREGVLAKEQVEGFELYLKTAERYRMEFYEKEKIFERYLPYAMAFGVATIWAKAFGDIAQAAPSWYSGYYGTHWLPVDFSRGLERGIGGAMNAAVTTAGSGGSGFSGGGVGGGFGGGGGGSW
ncbi:MAG: DUF2207 domain-containing protein [Patescibacteria group bacterium]|jgi:uncharacterized membrane protein YgcG